MVAAAAAAAEGVEVEVEHRPPAAEEEEVGECFQMAAAGVAAVAGCRMRRPVEAEAAVAEVRRRKRLVVDHTLSCSPSLGRLGRRAEGVHPRTWLLQQAAAEGEAPRVATMAPQRRAR